MSKLSVIQSALKSAYQSSNFKNSKLSKVNFSKLPMPKKIQYIKAVLKIAKLKYQKENRKVYKSTKQVKKNNKKYIFTPTILGIFTKKGSKKGTRLGFTGAERRYK